MPNKDVKISIGSRLKFLREKSGLTQEAAAQKLYINSFALSRIENEHTEPSLSVLEKMCKLYHVTSDYIMFGAIIENSNVLDLNGLTFSEINAVKTIVDSMRRS